MSTGSSIGVGASACSDKETDSIPGYPSTPEGAERHESKRSRKRKGKLSFEIFSKLRYIAVKSYTYI